MTSHPRGLGRGFETLIPQNFDASLLVNEDERIQKVPIDKLLPRDGQPRQNFDETALKELASSIKTHGVLLPLVVVPAKDGKYQIIAGERRWRAAKMVKLASLPVIVRTLKELEQLEVSLIENVQRVDLSPMEEAVSIERLHQQFNLTYDDIAKRLGKGASTVSNTARLVNLPPAIRDALVAEKISAGHARTILGLNDYPDRQMALLNNILKYGWSVRQTERYENSVKHGFKDESVVRQRVRTDTPFTRLLSKRYQTPVHIRRTAHGGSLEITFKSDQDLERIIKLIKALR
jgi:ParB family chromosome partitioning protein